MAASMAGKNFLPPQSHWALVELDATRSN